MGDSESPMIKIFKENYFLFLLFFPTSAERLMSDFSHDESHIPILSPSLHAPPLPDLARTRRVKWHLVLKPPPRHNTWGAEIYVRIGQTFLLGRKTVGP